MAFLFPKRKISDTENKLRVLLCISALGMATADQLWPFVAGLELMEYLPFCVFVDELKKDGSIAVGSHALEGMLYLTEAGARALSLFSGKVPHADRERILRAATGYAARLSERRKARAAYELAEEGAFCVSCTMREGDVPTLLLKMHTRDRTLAENAVKGFRACAPHLLMLMYTLPFAPDPEPLPVMQTQQEAISRAQSGQAALSSYGGHEHAAAVRLTDAAAQYDVLLLLPDREAAQGWARAALLEGDSLARRVTALFREARA